MSADSRLPLFINGDGLAYVLSHAHADHLSWTSSLVLFRPEAEHWSSGYNNGEHTDSWLQNEHSPQQIKRLPSASSL